MKRLKVGVVGVGHLGRFHAEKFARIPEAELVGVADIEEERAREVGQRLGVPWFTEWQALLSRAEALSIVTPTVTHYEIARKALLAGKHLFVEKPLTESPETAAELVELAQRQGLFLQVGHIERFQPSIKHLLSRVKRPLFIEADRLSIFSERSLDIDVVLDLMIHDLDLVLFLARGARLKGLLAAGAPVLSDKIDIASVRLLFENGLSANLTASRISLTPQRRFRVFEHGAYFSADTLHRKLFEVQLLPHGELRTHEEEFPEADPLYEELASFVTAVLSGKRPPVPGEEALVSLELASRIRKEIETQLQTYLAQSAGETVR
ncbi:Gfo/Idh/MocA family oxidoreductase [Thermosulfurimonas marina]|uniref:Gfo/Idh/MocA family oxidoreductase n=1 Tax=Thermosulfurimonas marina TaxID=2047767 RepID=A0A6H1WU08_9BACT|nr:Gfo/Idh/MocA family oxidoreductase [Thermosulfurimonas marina]QJA06687.1 Gfo/Idh/MocA family oxidoreductase [Thermosulfurimonas marina]